MHKIKEMLMNELYEYEEKAKKMSGGKLSQTELDRIQKLTKIVKNIDEIETYEEFGEDGESSYARGRGRNARRDSMGRYSREGGNSYDGGYSEEGGSYRRGGSSSYRGGSSYEGGNMGGGSSYRGGYSRTDAKEHMLDRLEEMMENAESPKEKEAIRQCMQKIESV